MPPNQEVPNGMHNPPLPNGMSMPKAPAGECHPNPVQGSACFGLITCEILQRDVDQLRCAAKPVPVAKGFPSGPVAAFSLGVDKHGNPAMAPDPEKHGGVAALPGFRQDLRFGTMVFESRAGELPAAFDSLKLYVQAIP